MLKLIYLFLRKTNYLKYENIKFYLNCLKKLNGFNRESIKIIISTFLSFQ